MRLAVTKLSGISYYRGSVSKLLNSYTTLALGEAAQLAGTDFLVIQTTNNGSYKYTRTQTGSIFKGVVLSGSSLSDYLSRRSSAANVSTVAVSGIKSHIWGQNAWEWDGRLVPNEVTSVLPSLNLLPDPYNPKNESGGGTPALDINTTATQDSLGGNNAEKITITAQNQQLRVYSTGVVIPSDTYRLRIQAKLLSGGSAYRLGSTSGLAINPTGTWSTYEVVLPSFSGISNVGISSATGNASSEVAVGSAQIFDPLAGESIPDSQQELDAQKAGHMKMPLAFVGSLPVLPNGSISINGVVGGALIHVDPDHNTVSAYTLGLWVDAQMPTSGYGNALSFDYHSISNGATNLRGQLGIYGSADMVAGRPGRLYVNPNLSTSVNLTNQSFPGQGKQFVAITVDNGMTVAYINGVPIWLGSATGWTAPKVSRLISGAYNSTNPRRKTTNPLVGSVNGIFYAPRALSPAEVLQMDEHGRERLEALGDTFGRRKILNIGCCDSLTAFGESWWWHLGENTNITPRVHGHLDAVGGTRLYNWIASPRYERLCQRIDAGVAAGYDEVWLYMLAGANDIDDWDSPTTATTYSYSDWKVAFFSFVDGLKARNPKVKVAILTMLPLPTGGLPTEVYRNTWNDDCRANWASHFNALIDTGLGTERVDASGNVTQENLPGGTRMGNWRVSQGAVTHSRNPSSSITLSATEGASFTATSSIGTFTQTDVYRKVVAGLGSASILSVNSDGSSAILSTTGFTPSTWNGETAATLSRDTVNYTSFSTLSYLSGAWSIQNDASFYQLDGLHPTYPGGRILCDVVSPVAQAHLDAIT